MTKRHYITNAETLFSTWSFHSVKTHGRATYHCHFKALSGARKNTIDFQMPHADTCQSFPLDC